jgi:hypothetical protein
MIISAGSVYYSENGVLVLDARITMRDLIAYMLSLIFLIYALKGTVIHALKETFDTKDWHKCLNVTLVHGIVLIFSYLVYVLVLAYYSKFVDIICPRTGNLVGKGEQNDASIGRSKTSSDVELASKRLSIESSNSSDRDGRDSLTRFVMMFCSSNLVDL